MIEINDKGVPYMTSDAKVGLLLGLVFIVTIAFLINGLPGLLADNGGKAVSTSVSSSHNSLGLDEKADAAIGKVKEYDPLQFRKREFRIEAAKKRDQRFNPSGNTDSSDKINQAAGDNFYVVKKGDNLAKIAKKYYGGEIGNKYDTIKKIYEANKNELPSPDVVKVGQKLKMPSLIEEQIKIDKPVQQTAKKPVKSMEDELVDTGMFEKVKNSIKNVFSGSDSSSNSMQAVYIVKSDDSLWEISSKTLGSGTRYREILKMNERVLKDPHDLSPGMKLLLPVK